MIEFILNNTLIKTNEPDGLPLLDFIRTNNSLKGTKIGCREGDCGACTVLEGTLVDGKLVYRSIVSCLTPLVVAHGKHIVTIEGINIENLNPVQEAFTNRSATQCGFCTPGFVVALTGFLMSDKDNDPHNAISGNICRCTGYKSIDNAVSDISKAKKELLVGNEIPIMVNKGWLPEYFLNIENRLKKIPDSIPSYEGIVGGGTDIMVQKSDYIRNKNLTFVNDLTSDKINIIEDEIVIGAATKIESFFNDEIVLKHYPDLKKYAPLVASEQIRNMGTLAGNLVNASPIGDLSSILLALNAKVVTSNGRVIELSNFFIDYKKIDLPGDEFITSICIPVADKSVKLNYEKVSKRTHLDIASVVTTAAVRIENNTIEHIRISAGGVAPIPKYLKNTCNFLTGKNIGIDVFYEAIEILYSDISPISDIRGSKEYKRLLIRQLFIKHFISLFPSSFSNDDILHLLKSKTPRL